MRLTSIRSVSRNQTLDAFISTWSWLPFWIQFLYAPDCLPRLGLDDSQPCLLRRRGFDLLTIDNDSARSATRPALRVLDA
jgi:hypothetical protein